MTLCNRRLVVLAVIAAMVLLADACIISGWLDRLGAVAWAQSIRAEFITGTAITVIVALLILLPPTSRPCPPPPQGARSCPVCDEMLRPGGKYCPACGSRV
jgi:hypothetical protein